MTGVGLGATLGGGAGRVAELSRSKRSASAVRGPMPSASRISMVRSSSRLVSVTFFR